MKIIKTEITFFYLLIINLINNSLLKKISNNDSKKTGLNGDSNNLNVSKKFQLSNPISQLYSNSSVSKIFLIFKDSKPEYICDVFKF